MSDDDVQDTNLLLVPATAGGPPAVPAEMRACSECGQATWVSLVLLARVDDGEMRPWCYGCAAASGEDLHFKQHPDQASLGMSIGSFDQLAARVRDRIAGARRG